MIEITGKLVRENTPVFLCGEVVECFVSFSNPSLPEHKIAQSHNDILENLAWASVQINCFCSSTMQEKSNESTCNKNTNETSLNTAVLAQGDAVFSTKPKILFCDLRLAPGETKSFLYHETLPITCPPTYRGVGIKYFYKITIATQRVGSKVQALRIPIRVLPLPTEVQADEVPALCNETNEELAPSNPFLETKKTESKFEIALHHLQNITARRRPNFYLISNKRGKVGRFCLFKPAYKLGEDIVGTLDFTSGTVRCIQVSVTLQCEEFLLKENKTQTIDGTGSGISVPSTTGTDNSLASENVGRIMNFTKYHEMCLGLQQTQMILPIPLFVTPSFKTELIELKWRLHFQFVTSVNDQYLDPSRVEESWQAPTDIDIETMVWNLPVTLYPTAPLQIPQQSGKHSLIIK